jgi:hypothetical protein
MKLLKTVECCGYFFIAKLMKFQSLLKNTFLKKKSKSWKIRENDFEAIFSNCKHRPG